MFQPSDQSMGAVRHRLLGSRVCPLKLSSSFQLSFQRLFITVCFLCGSTLIVKFDYSLFAFLSPGSDSSSHRTEDSWTIMILRLLISLIALNLVQAKSLDGNCGNCVFPFIFGGRKHTTCTTIDGDSPWCATEVDSSGAYVQVADYPAMSVC